jgi:hypothetical protein
LDFLIRGTLAGDSFVARILAPVFLDRHCECSFIVFAHQFRDATFQRSFVIDVTLHDAQPQGGHWNS